MENVANKTRASMENYNKKRGIHTPAAFGAREERMCVCDENCSLNPLCTSMLLPSLSLLFSLNYDFSLNLKWKLKKKIGFLKLCASYTFSL